MKLKPIPQNTVVHTPTEADAKELLQILHENGYTYSEGNPLSKNPYWNKYRNETCYCLECRRVSFSDRKWFKTNLYSILTLAEFKERYVEEEKPQSKFKVGDKVLIAGVINSALNHHVGSILELPNIDHPSTYKVGLADGYTFLEEFYLNPYPEPETKPTEDMETKDETKELNLCELLKGHEGEDFFSPISNTPLKLKAVFGRSLTFFLDEEEYLTIDFDGGGRITIPSLNGDSQLKYITDLKSQCLIYPSRALYEQYPLDPYAAWMKWQEEQMKHWVSVTVWIDDIECESDTAIDTDKIYFRTPTDRDKCIEEIKAIIEKNSK